MVYVYIVIFIFFIYLVLTLGRYFLTKALFKETNEFRKVFDAIKVNIKKKSRIEAIEEDLFWYIKSSEKYRVIYRLIATAHLITISLTPVVAIIGKENPAWVALMSSATAILYGVLSILSPKKKWQRYRNTAEYIKRILLEYDSKITEIDEVKEKKKLESNLINSVKELVINENKEWLKDHQKPQKEPK